MRPKQQLSTANYYRIGKSMQIMRWLFPQKAGKDPFEASPEKGLNRLTFERLDLLSDFCALYNQRHEQFFLKPVFEGGHITDRKIEVQDISKEKKKTQNM